MTTEQRPQVLGVRKSSDNFQTKDLSKILSSTVTSKPNWKIKKPNIISLSIYHKGIKCIPLNRVYYPVHGLKVHQKKKKLTDNGKDPNPSDLKGRINLLGTLLIVFQKGH